MTEPVIVAVLARSDAVAIAAVSPSRALEVVRLRKSSPDAYLRVAAKLAADYAAARIAVEPRLADCRAPANISVQTMDLSEARKLLEARDNLALCQRALDHYPQLVRFVKVLPATGALSRLDRRGLLILQTVALGLAAFQTDNSLS